jgi:hypothetical protein
MDRCPAVVEGVGDDLILERVLADADEGRADLFGESIAESGFARFIIVLRPGQCQPQREASGGPVGSRSPITTDDAFHHFVGGARSLTILLECLHPLPDDLEVIPRHRRVGLVRLGTSRHRVGLAHEIRLRR